MLEQNRIPEDKNSKPPRGPNKHIYEDIDNCFNLEEKQRHHQKVINTTHCPFCNSKFSKNENISLRFKTKKFTKQHIIPKRRGGSGYWTNMKACCHRCNGILGTMGDCPAMLSCLRGISLLLKHGPNHDGIIHVYRKLGLNQKLFD